MKLNAEAESPTFAAVVISLACGPLEMVVTAPAETLPQPTWSLYPIHRLTTTHTELMGITTKVSVMSLSVPERAYGAGSSVFLRHRTGDAFSMIDSHALCQ